MGEFKKCAIGKMINQLNGFAFKSELFNQDGLGTRLCRGINITRGNMRFDDSNEMFWSDDSIDLSKYLLERGDIVISMDGSLVGRNFAFVKENDLPLLLVQRVARLRAKSELCQEYLYQWIGSNHFVRYVDSVKTSSGIPHISASQINDFQIFLPPLPEQQKIAAILSKWDELIDTQTKLIEAKEKQKTSLMQKLLTGEVRFPGHTEKWRDYVLGEIGEFKNGINKSKEDFGFGKPFVNLLDIFGKPILKPGNFALVNATDKECEQFNLLHGDVLFVRSSIKPSGVGLTTIIEEDLIDTVYSGFIIRYRHQANLFDNVFKRYCFLEESFRNQLISKSSSSANTNINQENLKILKIKIPSITEQNKISSFLACLDDAIDSLKSELESLKLQKKGLMQQLLTGKIRVKA